MQTSMQQPSGPQPKPLPPLSELLAFRAPYLEERLVRERRVGSHEEVARLLDEVKKYLVLSRRDPSRSVPIGSRRIDEVWHQFVLFSEEYDRFCHRFFGRFVHHAPGETPPRLGPDGVVEPKVPELTREEFRREYELLFGPISELWRDEDSVSPDSRITRKRFHRPVLLRTDGEKAELVSSLVEGGPEQTILRVDAWAEPALSFIVACDHFYVRELPGPLTDDDRIAICRPLVQRGVFRITL